MSGTLYLVATPIGNRGDLSFRAVEVLKAVRLIASEDTRHSGKLLSPLGIATRRIPYHDFNKEQMAPVLVRKIQEGEDIALITDAGTPGIADPAFFLVRMALEAGIRVIPVPGPCAAVAALVASGLPPDRFVFENFAPKKKNKRVCWLHSLQNETRTVIVYESPKRIVDFLEDLREVFGNIHVVVARELTKVFEEILRMPAEQMIHHFQTNQPKGEFVVLFNLRYPGPAEPSLRPPAPAGGPEIQNSTYEIPNKK